MSRKMLRDSVKFTNVPAKRQPRIDWPRARRSASTSVTSKLPTTGMPMKVDQLGTTAAGRVFTRLSTVALLRSVILGHIMRSPFIYKPSLYILQKIANAKSPLWDADKNPFIRMSVYPLIYKHFCAGRNKAEVQQTIADIRRTGYAGVILCYSKEVMAQVNSKEQVQVEDRQNGKQMQQSIDEWREHNLTTLSMVSAGDYIGVKLTGAGSAISESLRSGSQLSGQVQQALYDICDQAQRDNKRLWIDAEQQLYHPTIDKWTVDLMRKYNRNGNIVVLTTVQAYLKSSRKTVEWYMKQAHAESWTLGIKLVRGAYIQSDVRSNIHDTKEDTDASYDSIARELLLKSWPGFDKTNFPDVCLFLAGHNVHSIRCASALAQNLAHSGLLKEPVRYGHLQGMADDIGCEMLGLAEQVKRDCQVHDSPANGQTMELGAPRVYKCLTWGPIKDCLHYLVRRAVENRSAAGQMGEGLKEMRTELRRRLLRI